MAMDAVGERTTRALYDEAEASVIICTRDRAASLSRTLESFKNASTGWTMKWELVVVNNGSRDATLELLTQALKERWAPLRVLEEPSAGVSRAKNRGAAEARGSVLAFTDDDCLVTSSWLPEILRPFHEDPDVGVVGGRSELADDRLFPHCVRTSRVPMTYRWPTEPDFAAGNNLAIRANALRRVGGFDTRLGPGTKVHSAEDNELIYRLLRAGYSARFTPEALLYHDHRRSDADLRPIRRNYAVGTGAFLAKHVLSGDLYAAKMAYWQIRTLLVRPKSAEGQGVDRGTVLRAIAAGALRRLLYLD
jgi:GT2 family glycosyltransferase